MSHLFFFFFLISFVHAGNDKDNDDEKKYKDEKSVLSTLPLTQNCNECETDFESIKALHRLLDDDHNGNVDQLESDEFIRDELKYTDGFDRQSKFHGGDKLISVDDLWRVWISSPVYNWTVDDVLDWLVIHVELGQYVEAFKSRGINGTALPKVAVNSNHFLSDHLGVKNSVHKQKLSLKAVDIVLFGPPKKAHSYVKDLALILSLVVAVGGCWFAYSQYRYSQSHMKRMTRDLDSLQRAEDALVELQNKLDLAEQGQRSVTKEKENLKQQFTDEISTAMNEAERLRQAREGTMEEISRLKLAEEELKQVRSALQQAEAQLESRPALSDLQPWLQLCHEIELKHYQEKRTAAEKQLALVREECQKMRKKKSGVVGAMRSASIDEIDKKIASARAAFDEVRHDLQERQHRWASIEYLTKFPIVQNHGLAYLCSLLQRDINSYGTVLISSGIISIGSHVKPMGSIDSMDDDFPSHPQLKSHGGGDPSNGYGGNWPHSSMVRRSVSQHTNLSTVSDSSVPVKFDLDDPSIPEENCLDTPEHDSVSLPANIGESSKSKNQPRRSVTSIELRQQLDNHDEMIRSKTISCADDLATMEPRKSKKKKLLTNFLKKEKTQ